MWVYGVKVLNSARKEQVKINFSCSLKLEVMGWVLSRISYESSSGVGVGGNVLMECT